MIKNMKEFFGQPVEMPGLGEFGTYVSMIWTFLVAVDKWVQTYIPNVSPEQVHWIIMALGITYSTYQGIELIKRKQKQYREKQGQQKTDSV